VAVADGCALGRHPGALWATYDVREPLQPPASSRSPGTTIKTVSVTYGGDVQMIDSSSIGFFSTAPMAVKRGARLHGSLRLHGSVPRRPHD
jgi:hypothetical protein